MPVGLVDVTVTMKFNTYCCCCWGGGGCFLFVCLGFVGCCFFEGGGVFFYHFQLRQSVFKVTVA